MPSERVQRRIDALLDEADTALGRKDGAAVVALCQQVLALDSTNADAKAYLAATEAGVAPPAVGVPESVTPAARPLPASFVAGRYKVLSQLGEGGRKVVYRARDTVLKREVAFALIKTDGLDAAGRERVRREAELLAQLGTHPNVVTIFELGEDDGRPYLVSEFLSGGDLAKLVTDAPDHRLSLSRVLELAVAVTKGLAYAHTHGVVHRDLKPGNVWLTDDGTPKLGDFGLALSGADPRLTQAGMIAGTALYMAPEQATGGEVTARGDLYSLGCLLYELVTGRPPFVGDESIAIIGQHLHANPVSPSWHRPDCPSALEALILRLLEKDPRKRPAAAAEVAEALAGISLSTRRTTSESRRQAQASGPSPVYQRAFVGREQELRQLEGAFDAAVSGQGGLVMVVGEPGIGKTTLTEQLATYAGLRGGRVLVGHCYEEGSLSLPYLPFVEALRSYVLAREPDQLRSELGTAAPEVARIVSEVRDRVQVEAVGGTGGAGEDRYRLLQGVCSFLRKAAQIQPLVLVLEDLHDAEHGTLDLLIFLARQLGETRLVVVGTYRDVEVDRNHPLSATLAELRRLGNFGRILLRGLTADEVQRMLSAIAGQSVPWGLAEGVHRQTEGNPLFVQEVMRYLAEEGLIKREGGQWAAGDRPLLANIPEGLRDVIGKRLARLSPACNQILTLAAVIGRDFALQTLQTIAGVPDDALLATVEEALKVAVLQDQSRPGSVRYRFAHAFFRQTLYEELITPRRLRLHQQVARALEVQYAGRLDEHASELAEHFAQSSGPAELAKAVAYGTRAARRALAVYAYGEAVRLFEQALAVQDVLDPDDAAIRCALLLALTEALPAAGDSQRAFEQTAPAAFALAEQVGDRGRAWQSAHAALTALRWYGGNSFILTPASAAWAERCAAYATPGTREQLFADVWLARLSGLNADRHKRAAARRRAWALAGTLDDAEAWSEAAQMVMGPTGENMEEALAAALAVAARPRTGPDSATAGEALRAASRVLLSWGRREAAESLLREVRGSAERANNVRLRLAVEAFEIELLTIDGRLEDVLAGAERLIAQGDALGLPQNARELAYALQIRARWLLGRHEEALAANRNWLRYIDQDPASATGNSLVRDALALAHLGRLKEAEAELEDFDRRLGEPDEFSWVGHLIWVLEAGILLEDRPRVTRFAALLAGTAGMALTAGGTVCPARLFGDAMRFLGEREHAQAYYVQALETAGSISFRPEIALARLGLAELLTENDIAEQHEAQAHLAFVIRECEAMGMAPALTRARALQARISPPSPPVVVDAAVAVAGVATPADRARHVFISYSSEDRAAAFALEATLKAEDIPVWLDRRSIAAGSSWDAAIVDGIKQSALVAVFVSPKAVASDNVRQELRLAMQYKKPILPLLLAPTAFPGEVEYVLAGRQWIDLVGRSEEAGCADVLAAVRRLV